MAGELTPAEWPLRCSKRGVAVVLAGHRAEGFDSGLSLSEVCGGGLLKEHLIVRLDRILC